MVDVSGRTQRRHPEKSQGAREGDHRSPAEHDRDRILYSPEFRRLSGITQVISPSGNHPTHNRLTHTLEVAQIAKAMASNLLHVHRDSGLLEEAGGLDPVVVEAAAMAHDIGHPPFGHVTEDVLNEILRRETREGFEGNAQSFRILTRLATRDDTYQGLNLTRATLSAVSKYPWLEGTQGIADKKWGAYAEQEVELLFSRDHLPDSWKRIPQNPDYSVRTLEAMLMDWADDIAYAIHDVEDFFRVGLIPLDRLRSDDAERERFFRYHISEKKRSDDPTPNAEIHDISEALLYKSSPFTEPYTGTSISRATLHRRSSSFIHRYILSVHLRPSPNTKGWELHIDPEIRTEVEILKSLLWYYVIDNRGLLSLRFGYTSLIESLFEHLREAAVGRRKNLRIFPEFFRAEMEADNNEPTAYRTIADFISTMTESQVVDLHHRLTGISFGNSLDQIVD
jgi:dGTPase